MRIGLAWMAGAAFIVFALRGAQGDLKQASFETVCFSVLAIAAISAGVYGFLLCAVALCSNETPPPAPPHVPPADPLPPPERSNR